MCFWLLVTEFGTILTQTFLFDKHMFWTTRQIWYHFDTDLLHIWCVIKTNISLSPLKFLFLLSSQHSIILTIWVTLPTFISFWSYWLPQFLSCRTSCNPYKNNYSIRMKSSWTISNVSYEFVSNIRKCPCLHHQTTIHDDGANTVSKML